MRIKELEIGNFKNLRDVSVEFDSDQLSTVLIGRNGTGKSNLLEALVVLFRDLDLLFGDLDLLFSTPSLTPPHLQVSCSLHRIC